MLETILEPEIAQQVARAPGRLPAREAADHLRHDHVLDRGEFHQQVVELVDEADLDAADARALGVREREVATWST